MTIADGYPILASDVQKAVKGEMFIHMNSNVITTSYDEKIGFFIPAEADKIEVRVLGYRSSDSASNYPNGLMVRVNGATEYGPWGDGTSDTDSGWIDITSDIAKDSINTMEFKTATATKSKAVVIIRCTTNVWTP